MFVLNPIQDGFFRGWSRTGACKKSSFPKIYHTYPTKMALGTNIPYLKKTQKISPITKFDATNKIFSRDSDYIVDMVM